jgi:hypothetical protein
MGPIKGKSARHGHRQLLVASQEMLLTHTSQGKNPMSAQTAWGYSPFTQRSAPAVAGVEETSNSIDPRTLLTQNGF